MPALLIDTDWVIDHLNGIGVVRQRLRELSRQGLAVSVISIAELWEGVYYSKDPQRSRTSLEKFLSGITVLQVSEQVAERFGWLRGSLRSQGRMIGDFDLLIAASASALNLTLLTNNRRHFEVIEGLRIESTAT